MKKNLICLLFIIVGYQCFAQIEFEKGYFIYNDNTKIECLIKNMEWRFNPKRFKYKLSENAEIQEVSIESVQEFGVKSVFKYKRLSVNIDRSSEDVGELTRNKKPQYREEKLFLKVLVEGDATLFEYIENNFRRYFLQKENSSVEQLVFKKYKTYEGEISLNSRFRQQLIQLWNESSCKRISNKTGDKIKYTKRSLLNFIIKYNSCSGNTFTNFEKKKANRKDIINLNLRPGIGLSSFKMDYVSGSEVKFNEILSYRFGVEAELVMPYNKNKWAIIIEPTFQSVKSNKEIESTTTTVVVTTKTKEEVQLDYKSLELPLGLRHYIFLNDDSKIFINSSYLFDFQFNSIIEFEKRQDLEIVTGSNLIFGLGYNYRKKFNVELRYSMNRKLLKFYRSLNSDYDTLSLIFGYTIY